MGSDPQPSGQFRSKVEHRLWRPDQKGEAKEYGTLPFMSFRWIYTPLHCVIKEMALPTATSCHILLLTVFGASSQFLSGTPGWPTYHITLLNLTVDFGKTSNIFLIDLFVSASRIQCLLGSLPLLHDFYLSPVARGLPGSFSGSPLFSYIHSCRKWSHLQAQDFRY